MCKYIIIVVIGVVFLLPGCSSLHNYGGKSPREIEQAEIPETWKEVYRLQVTLWPLEKKVNELRDELAATKLSSLQASKNIESLQAEIQQLKSEIARRVEESKKAGPGIQSIVIKDIQYYKVSKTRDRVLIYMSTMNIPQIETLGGKTPRIVLDFLNTRNIGKGKNEIKTNGNYIKRIQVRSYKKPIQKVQVIFYVMPDKKFSVDQQFSEKENIYSFDLKAQ